MSSSASKKRSNLDRLPDHLLIEILSYLPLKSAVATAVLSPRWRWLWTHLQDVELSFNRVLIKQKGYVEVFDLVQNILQKFASPSIRKFSLYFGSDKYNARMVKKIFPCCFDWALRKQVQELRFEIEGRDGNFIPNTPLCVFQITSLVVLNLRPWFFLHDNQNSFRLPNLKKLNVDLYTRRNYRVLEKLISCSPSLEDLSFTSSSHNHKLKLSGPRLKRLDMRVCYSIHAVIDAPNLEYLIVNDKDRGFDPHRISFVNSPTALLDFSFFSYNNRSLERSFDPCNLFSVIAGVSSLNIIAQKTSPLIAPLTFTHLTHLKLREMSDLVGLALLQQCPVLEVLSIELTEWLHSREYGWSLPDSPPQCIVTCVKRIEILVNSLYNGTDEMVLQLLKYWLGTGKSLELITINIAPPDLDEYEGMDPKLHLINQLLDTSKSCPQCRIEIYDPHRRVLGGGILSDESVTSLLH